MIFLLSLPSAARSLFLFAGLSLSPETSAADSAHAHLLVRAPDGRTLVDERVEVMEIVISVQPGDGQDRLGDVPTPICGAMLRSQIEQENGFFVTVMYGAGDPFARPFAVLSEVSFIDVQTGKRLVRGLAWKDERMDGVWEESDIFSGAVGRLKRVALRAEASDDVAYSHQDAEFVRALVSSRLEARFELGRQAPSRVPAVDVTLTLDNQSGGADRTLDASDACRVKEPAQ